jgi:hypothetical protein
MKAWPASVRNFACNFCLLELNRQEVSVKSDKEILLFPEDWKSETVVYVAKMFDNTLLYN